MINDLISNSEILDRYFQDKLLLINKPIIWLLNPKLDANMRSIDLKDMYAIIVKEVPVKEKDYFDIAHEIGHLIFGEQGYPMTRPKDNDPNKRFLGTILTNTVMDPKINSNLISYGFNFIEYLNKNISGQIPTLQNYPNEYMLNLFDKHFIKCLLIEKILEWDMLEEDIINPFECICKEKYPNIYLETLEETKFVREIGIDTPEKVRIIIKRILDNNQMSGFIEVI